MKKYYYTENQKQFGPVTIGELEDLNISKDTLIWYEGIENWVKAEEVNELKVLFSSTPPPLNSQTPPNITSNTKKKSKKWIIFLIVGLLLAAILVNFSLKNNQPREKTEQELRQELLNKESRRPKDYLSVKYKLKYRVLSGKDEIIGKISNSASMVTFKDIVLTVKFSTETGTLLSSKNYVIYKYVNSGTSIPFTIKTVSPRGTKKIGVYIDNADIK